MTDLNGKEQGRVPTGGPVRGKDDKEGWEGTRESTHEGPDEGTNDGKPMMR